MFSWAAEVRSILDFSYEAGHSKLFSSFLDIFKSFYLSLSLLFLHHGLLKRKFFGRTFMHQRLRFHTLMERLIHGLSHTLVSINENFNSLLRVSGLRLGFQEGVIANFSVDTVESS